MSLNRARKLRDRGYVNQFFRISDRLPITNVIYFLDVTASQ
ncbi:MAG: hypothetical protein RMY34_01975 [Aulosira sp. DedQUE10]|nr:hypothetical protein [Aulosira sp. DedQUE10]